MDSEEAVDSAEEDLVVAVFVEADSEGGRSEEGEVIRDRLVDRLVELVQEEPYHDHLEDLTGILIIDPIVVIIDTDRGIGIILGIIIVLGIGDGGILHGGRDIITDHGIILPYT